MLTSRAISGGCTTLLAGPETRSRCARLTARRPVPAPAGAIDAGRIRRSGPCAAGLATCALPPGRPARGSGCDGAAHARLAPPPALQIAPCLARPPATAHERCRAPRGVMRTGRGPAGPRQRARRRALLRGGARDMAAPAPSMHACRRHLRWPCRHRFKGGKSGGVIPARSSLLQHPPPPPKPPHCPMIEGWAGERVGVSDASRQRRAGVAARA